MREEKNLAEKGALAAELWRQMALSCPEPEFYPIIYHRTSALLISADGEGRLWPTESGRAEEGAARPHP